MIEKPKLLPVSYMDSHHSNPSVSVKASVPFSGGSNYLNANTNSRRRRVATGRPTDVKKNLSGQTRETLVKNSRVWEVNSGQMAQVFQDFRIYTVGDRGFGVKPRSEDEEWNIAAKRYFEDWAFMADITGQYNLTELCVMIAGLLPFDGEVFAVKTKMGGEPVIQLLETHRFSTRTNKEERIYDGVKVNKNQRPTAYIIKDENGIERSLPASSVMHIFDPKRPSAVRYAPHVQHSLDKVNDVYDVLDTEVGIIKALQDVARVLKSDTPNRVADEEFNIDIPGVSSTEETESVSDQLSRERGEKTIQLGKDEELEALSMERPGSEFMELMTSLKREANMGILPFEFSLDPNGVTGSAMRLIVGKADRIFRWNSQVIINRFLNRVWFYVIGHAIDNGRLPAVEGWHRAKFTPPKRITVDFGRDAMQNRLDIEAGLKNYGEDYEERGLDEDEEMIERERSIRKLYKLQGYEDWDKRNIPDWQFRKVTGMSLSETLTASSQTQTKE